MLKKELKFIIEYCDQIAADKRAKKVAVSMWNSTFKKYIDATMVTMEKCYLHGISGMITYYEENLLPRDAFFIYMNDIIEKIEH